MHLGEGRVAQHEPVVAVPECERVRGKLDRIFQPGEQIACLGHVGPQHDPAAAARAARLQFDRAAIGERDVERPIAAFDQLLAAERDERVGVETFGLRNLAARDLQPNQVGIVAYPAAIRAAAMNETDS